MRAATRALLARTRRGQLVIEGADALETLWPWWVRTKEFWEKHKPDREGDPAWLVFVEEDDAMFDDLRAWLTAQMPEHDRYAMTAVTSKIDDWGDETPAESEGGPRKRLGVQLVTSTGGKVWLRIDGHEVLAEIGHEKKSEEDEKQKPGDQAINITVGEGFPTKKSEVISFTSETREGRDAVVAMLDAQVAERYRAKPATPDLFMPSYGGGWNRRGDLPTRDLESVILKEGQAERIVADLEEFLASEEWYGKTSQPWHRGYLLHGPPGTGKTSAARAIAAHFGMDCYYMPLADVEKDTDLTNLVSRISARSVLLLEDVDAFGGSTAERVERDKKVSMAAMLNSLDGIFTPHGLVTIMTTNHKERLDPALIRAGRVDADEEFSLMDLDQARRLATYLEVEGLEAEEFEGRPPSEMTAAAVALKRRPRELHATGGSDDKPAGGLQRPSAGANGDGGGGRFVLRADNTLKAGG